ncbi:hypothetical protein [Variovorax paradoxus]|uniref:hypothetical protein n=1 Tax=Variovorax paradoxus TaxID=34073 RepID=UPI003ECD0D8E
MKLHRIGALLIAVATASCAVHDTLPKAPSPEVSAPPSGPNTAAVQQLHLECEASGKRTVGTNDSPIHEMYFISISDMGPQVEKRMLIEVRGKTLVDETFFSWSDHGEMSNAIIDSKGWRIVTTYDPAHRIRTLDIDRQVGTFKLTRGDFGDKPPKFLSVSGPCKPAGPARNEF